MHHNHPSRRRPALVAPSAVILALALSACGSGGSNQASSGTASAGAPVATAAKNAAAPPAGFAGGFAALHECLAGHGITLPPSSSGARLGDIIGSLVRGSRAKLPAGVSRSQFEAVLRVCGGLPVLRGGTRGFGRLRSPQYRAALTRFAACLRSRGIKLPAPNTSGAGPVFDNKGIDTSSPQYKAATAACAGQLRVTG